MTTDQERDDPENVIVDRDAPALYADAKSIIEAAGGTVTDPPPPQTAGSKLVAMLRGYGCVFPLDPEDPADLGDRVLAKLGLVEQPEPRVTVEVFVSELDRVQGTVETYQALGPNGMSGALLVKSTINRAKAALESTSADRIDAAYDELQGCQ